MPWPSINPGELRHRLTFLDPVSGQDASGAVVTYLPATPPVTARAKMEALSATDVIKSGQDVSEVLAVFTVRYQSWIGPNQRFTTELGSTWIIKAIKDVENRRRLLEMICLGLGANE